MAIRGQQLARELRAAGVTVEIRARSHELRTSLQYTLLCLLIGFDTRIKTLFFKPQVERAVKPRENAKRGRAAEPSAEAAEGGGTAGAGWEGEAEAEQAEQADLRRAWPDWPPAEWTVGLRRTRGGIRHSDS